MSELKMLVQNDLERESYGGRLKAVTRERDEAWQMAAHISGLWPRLLRCLMSASEDFAGRGLDELRDLADRPERDLTG
jgi:hypothetical protein